jgi:hypothetical protein
MSSQRTESSKYTSGYAPAGEVIYVRGDQLLAERCCARQAARDKIHLGPKFWNEDYWLKEFRKQLRQAKILIDELSSKGVENPVEIIIRSMNHWKLKSVFSLGLKSQILPVCMEIFRQEGLRSPSESVNIQADAVDVNQAPRPPVGNKTLFSKLKEL